MTRQGVVGLHDGCDDHIAYLTKLACRSCAKRITTSGTPCQDNGPVGDKDAKSAGADSEKDGAGSGSSGRTKSTAHFTPEELQGILQVGDFRLFHGSPSVLLRSKNDPSKKPC